MYLQGRKEGGGQIVTKKFGPYFAYFFYILKGRGNIPLTEKGDGA